MGTVPDPLRSAKLSLAAAPEKENGLGGLQSPKCLYKQASIERSSNGLSYKANMQPAGDCLLEVNCATETDVPRGELHCGYDPNQPSMFSPGSFSPSKEGCPMASELVNNSEQEGSNDSRAKGTSTSCASVCATDEVVAAQEASKMAQMDIGGQLHRAVDEASSPSGGGDSIKESKPHDYPSLPARSSALQLAPKARETVSEMNTPEKTLAPDLATKSEAASGLEVKSCVCSDAELTVAKDAGSQPSARTVPESVPRSELESTSRPPCSEAIEKSAPEPSTFRDTGTMTVQPDDKPGVGEGRNRTHQDAEVQAVASMESKSASTSPSIFATFLRENLPSESKQKQEQLHIIYTGAGGKEQSIVDRFVPLVQTAPSTGIVPDVHIRASAAVDQLETQAGKLQEGPTGTHDTVHLTLLDGMKHSFPLASGSTQEASVSRTEAQITSEAGNLSDVSQQLSDSSILLKTKPVYQITVNISNPPAAPPQPVNIDTELPPSAALPDFNSKPSHPRPGAKENNQASSSCHRTAEQAKATVGAQGSHQGEHLQNKTVSGVEAGPVNVHVDVKPKREEMFISPDPKPQETSKTGAEPLTTRTPVTVKKEQDAFPKDNKEAKASSSQNLAAGLESELRRDSIRSLGTQMTKSSESRKGQKVDPSASASAQHVSKLGDKKKERKSAAEAKAQLKQSKRIRDVVWDEQGMTWEVYGASLDPESLGIAIQNHLQRQIREHEKLIKAQNTQNRKSISSDTSSNKKLKGRQHSVFQSMLQNFRRPNCCVRPAASSVLD
ncbi:G protein-regulated inducer of neurite outgrowth 3 [Tiliqua scincoides]|uniref:G protein-regulated inducer of neurite outgrowth 3 n=1 Tax=Tiliqua scincoides TaxID=71010 RepID=UPI003461CCCC